MAIAAKPSIREGQEQQRQPLPPQDAIKPEPTKTSRLIVKGLPKYADEQRVKEHFSSHGHVTDVKVMRTRQGTSRLFGFVGFASVQDAEAAQRYFHRTYMDASKLEVEFAQRVGSEEGRRNAWSKYTDGTSRNKEMVRKAGGAAAGQQDVRSGAKRKNEDGKDVIEEDPKLREFLALMQPRHKKAVWSNDDEMGIGEGVALRAEHRDVVARAHDEGAGSDGEYEDIQEDMPPDQEAYGAEGGEAKDAVVADTGVSDLDYMKARMTGNFSDDDDGDDHDDDDDDSNRDEGAAAEMAAEVREGEGVDHGKARTRDQGGLANEDDNNDDKDGNTAVQTPILDIQDDDDGDDGSNPISLIAKSSRLFLRNLPYSADEDDIRSFFESNTGGELENVHIITDKATRKSKGYALIKFERSEDAIRAFQELDGSIFMGRLLHILPGKLAPQQQDEDNAIVSDEKSSYKKDKEAKLKGEAKSNKVAWNSLFMRADTVADAVADMYSMSKADLLDPSASDMAVRLALGEVKVINMTKEHLTEQGVNIGALEAAAQESGGGKKKGSKARIKRSDTIIIIKNLPFALDEEELKGLFSNAGPILRWILPPSHTMAVVEFSDSQDANKAFKALAFKRYRSVPIYLEWAPRNIFDPTGGAGEEKRKDAAAEAAAPSNKIAVKADPLALIENAEGDTESSSTIFVKNLAFKTKKAAFEKHFRAVVEASGGALRSAKISQRKKDNKMVSAGFGFVECSSESVAKDVVKKLQGSALDGHNLVLQIAAGGKERGTSASKRKGTSDAKQSTKISVKNLAFEATRQDVLDLFTALGEVKSCRLPRKFDGTHRGFAFVDFASAAEAKTAITSISGTHLYGRRLVLEYAAEDTEEH